MTISKRVMTGGKVVGTLCMDMFITSLGDLINGEAMPENCYGSLVDSDFRTVFHPSESFAYDDEPPEMDTCGVKNYDRNTKPRKASISAPFMKARSPAS